jgi:nucleotide-binding universal stress UspA family protein
MKLRKILFPSDFSTKGDEALEYAATLARDTGARLLVMHVQEPPINYGEGSFYYGVPNPDEREIRNMLNRVRPHDASVAVEHFSTQGDPAVEIADLAKREGADLIVMSSHGRTGLGRLLMGSVAEGVMRRAECPVLIVKPTKAEKPREVARSRS